MNKRERLNRWAKKNGGDEFRDWDLVFDSDGHWQSEEDANRFERGERGNAKELDLTTQMPDKQAWRLIEDEIKKIVKNGKTYTYYAMRYRDEDGCMYIFIRGMRILATEYICIARKYGYED